MASEQSFISCLHGIGIVSGDLGDAGATISNLAAHYGREEERKGIHHAVVKLVSSVLVSFAKETEVKKCHCITYPDGREAEHL